MPNYGRLSRRSLDEMIAGARVDVAPYKRGDMDFVLWKPSKENEPGWDSPWGRGRPGWHIECSAMSWAHLGETFDIHGGGIDLVFPHHENEIAQSCCAFDREVMANYWMHNGFLQVEGEKMSKSLGNFVTIHELLHTEKFGGRSWSGEVLRLAMLRTHYREPIDWTARALFEAQNLLDRWYREAAIDLPSSPPNEREEDREFMEALEDDLNIPRAISRLHALFANAGPPTSGWAQIQAKRRFARSAQILGVMQMSAYDWFKDRSLSGEAKAKVETLIVARNAARASKNWAESDHIRDELAAMGIALKDNKDGTTTWEVKR
jgi:cysteinyl-tRNA synthetase